MNADRTLLTGKMGEELSPLLPGQAWSCGVTAVDTRGFVEAVRRLGRAGAPWRNLPPHLGQWHRVYGCFARWRNKGAREKRTSWSIANKQKTPHARQRQVDSTSVRGQQQDTVTAGQAGDAPEAAGLLAPWLAPAQKVVADAAYDSDALRALVAEMAKVAATAVIKPRPRRKNKPHVDPTASAKRYPIEQAINKPKQFGRIATRYDKLDRTLGAFLCLRIITLYLN